MTSTSLLMTLLFDVVGSTPSRRLSAADEGFELLWVARPLDRDLGGGSLDVAQVLGRQLDGDGTQVLGETTGLGGAGDRDDPRLLGEQPRQRDLCGRGVLAGGDLAEQIDERLVRCAGLRGETGQPITEVRAVKRRVCVDLAREEALAERAVGHETDAELFERSQQLVLGLT